MSIWGKIVGGTAGFAVGGPLGAILGGLAGHAVDRMRDSTRELTDQDTDPQRQAGEQPEADQHADDNTKKIAFTIGVIVLGAKMAKADGVVTKDEIQAFRQVFQVPPEEVNNVGKVFNQARRDSRGFEPYAKQLGRMFKDNPMVLEEVLDGLFHIARADGQIAQAELEYLEQVAFTFGLDQESWERIRAANAEGDGHDPYEILGVSREASDDEIKSAYRRLVRENHPDTLVSQGMPQEFIDMANEKVAAINGAYEQIRKQRGLRR
ncbi:TerB family tellurite resistance protein [Rhodovibrio salinarum]|uniref:Molecular chaperone DjlA n=1 Tax=Rhodovibrio salinarum TaxID=1087 RepID=A0A934QGR1_9PROT|nr:TerB family tellurite resistance protein [Rhodovibrio salinarum]MBK1696487.1 molecular chaperone DjlA [Rhodovibrio salinarum]